MRPTSKTESREKRLPRLVSFRPVVELLEDRLPPGDVLLGRIGGLVAGGSRFDVGGQLPKRDKPSQYRVWL
jgi:hypothetical protein